eukprot:CAMPEP_0177524442 /NCGR_PEP_ID=MMETSP0369-20130122/49972_1 /TAXON_ID=447022 ORGANISM="Scrippsiella hangoei-like, Strain SHHI-4" /NCGR_SAMPLE_ID=MMETSP0369 /ASSEMBLY_ACC=CAM_ASM_000364 /LENGTH=47 /DNA_ID= /DNA_START= /DNA_END= /DNA_ORIENTATION=
MSAHGMSVLLRRARAPTKAPQETSPLEGLAPTLRSSTRTLCTKARGL